MNDKNRYLEAISTVESWAGYLERKQRDCPDTETAFHEGYMQAMTDMREELRYLKRAENDCVLAATIAKSKAASNVAVGLALMAIALLITTFVAR